MRVCTPLFGMWCLERPNDRIIFLGIGIIDGCELICGCQEFNPSHLEEKSVLLTVELSVQSAHSFYMKKKKKKTGKTIHLPTINQFLLLLLDQCTLSMKKIEVLAVRRPGGLIMTFQIVGHIKTKF